MFAASAIVRCCSEATSRLQILAARPRAQPALETAERDGEAGELLARIVVEIARDARPLDFLRRDQAARQMPNLLIAFPQDGFLLANRLLGALAFGDVHLRPDHALWRPIRSAQHGSAREEPAHAAILVRHPMLDFILGDAALDARLRLGRHHRYVVRMDPGSPVVRTVRDFRVLEAQDRLQRRIHVDLVCLQVPVPDADGAGGGRQRVALLAFTQRIFGCLRSVISRHEPM